MDDLISRQAAIDSVNEVTKWYWKAYKEKRPTTAAVIDILIELPSAQPEQRWIPVEERLPEDKSSVLVYCPEFKNTFCAYLDQGIWWVYGAYYTKVFGEVVAWMPLPEPYTTQSNNSNTLDALVEETQHGKEEAMG